MGKHARRVIVIRCNATDATQKPAKIFKAGKYQYDFPRDDLKPSLVANAIAEYRADEGIPAVVVVTTTASTIQNR